MREKLLNYGYLWLGMKKISYGYALELFERGTKDSDNVYLLYEDNTENLAGEFGIELKDYDNYVVFVLGRDLLKGILPYENDIAYEWCVNLAKDFEISDFNVNTKGLYECLEEYVKANFYLDDNGNMSFRGHDLYETIGGVRI